MSLRLPALRLPPTCVVGSINIDITARTERLPRAGETVGGSTLRREPGGKGANQAAAAARLGSRTRMIGAVGDDSDGRWVLDALTRAGVDTTGVAVVEEPTGTALIVVDRHGENQIAVCPGANDHVAVDHLVVDPDEVVLTQLEISVELVRRLAQLSVGYLALNAAPARSLPPELLERADLVVVNETEYQLIPELRRAPLVAVTYGSRGAALLARGEPLAAVPAAAADVVNSVGAGDAFCAALTLALAAGLEHETALRAAAAVGAAAVADPASQPRLRTLDHYL